MSVKNSNESCHGIYLVVFDMATGLNGTGTKTKDLPERMETNAKAFFVYIAFGLPLVFAIIAYGNLFIGKIFAGYASNPLTAILIRLIVVIFGIFIGSIAVAGLGRKIVIMPELEKIESGFNGKIIDSKNYRANFLHGTGVPPALSMDSEIEVMVYFKKFYESFFESFFDMFSFNVLIPFPEKNFSLVLVRASLKKNACTYLGKGVNDLPDLDRSGHTEIIAEDGFVASKFKIYTNHAEKGKIISEKISPILHEIAKKPESYLESIIIQNGMASINCDLEENNLDKTKQLLEIALLIAKEGKTPNPQQQQA